MFKTTSTLLLGLCVLAAGCQPNDKPDQKEVARARWNTARANVVGQLARQQFEKGDFDGSRKSVNNAIALDPNIAAFHILSARLDIEAGRLEPANRSLDVARGLDPANGEVDYLAGVIHQRWQRLPEAYNFYCQAAEKNPTELAYLLAKTEMLVVMGQSDEALAILRERVSFFENSAEIRVAAGQILVSRQRYDEAVQVLRQASLLAPDDEKVREQLAMALYYNRRFSEARQLWREARELNRIFGSIWRK